MVAAAAFGRLVSTFRQIRRYRQLLLFLAAFWLYNDGIGTIIKMAIAYGDEVGIGRNDLITALVLTQFVGIPCTFLFGRLARVLGTKRSILVGLGVYGLISVAGYFMQTALHFYILAGLVGMVQGGTQALSRSLYASMIPRARSAEFFGFYSTSSRFAGIFGPLVFGVVSQLTGGSRLGIVSLIFFFVAGGALLLLVDEREGARTARQEEGQLFIAERAHRPGHRERGDNAPWDEFGNAHGTTGDPPAPGPVTQRVRERADNHPARGELPHGRGDLAGTDSPAGSITRPADTPPSGRPGTGRHWPRSSSTSSRRRTGRCSRSSTRSKAIPRWWRRSCCGRGAPCSRRPAAPWPEAEIRTVLAADEHDPPDSDIYTQPETRCTIAAGDSPVDGADLFSRQGTQTGGSGP